MNSNNDMQIKGFFFEVLRKEYISRFGERKWDGMFLNYFVNRRKPFDVIFSWNWRSRRGEGLVAEIEIDNHNGGDKLYKYLKENAPTLNSYEWFVMPGMSRIIYEIHPDVNIGSLPTNKDFRHNLVETAARKMHLLEEDFLHLINRYFEEYID